MARLPTKSRASKNQNLQQVDLGLDTEPAWVVYILRDPRVEDFNQSVRYVGKTHRKPQERLMGHLSEVRRGKRTHKCNMLRELLAASVFPIQEIIEVGTSERDWQKAEIAWIAYYRALGCPLTNATDGGEGTINPSAETRAKRSMSCRGYVHTPDARAAISKALKGRVFSEVWRRRISAAGCGRKLNARQIEVLARGRAQNWTKVGAHERASMFNTNRKLSEENEVQIEKMYADGLTQAKIAIEYGMTQSAISKVLRRRRH